MRFVGRPHDLGRWVGVLQLPRSDESSLSALHDLQGPAQGGGWGGVIDRQSQIGDCILADTDLRVTYRRLQIDGRSTVTGRRLKISGCRLAVTDRRLYILTVTDRQLARPTLTLELHIGVSNIHQQRHLHIFVCTDTPII